MQRDRLSLLVILANCPETLLASAIMRGVSAPDQP